MIQIIAWHKFQHYHNRRYPPLWVKFFPKILDNPLFMHLSRDAQLLLWKLWLITSQAKQDGALPLNIVDIAWRLRMEEGETYRCVMELAEVMNEDGDPQWLTREETPLDHVLKQRLDHDGDGSRPSLDEGAYSPDVPTTKDPGEVEHEKALAKSRSVESTGENTVGLDDSHRDSFKNEKENRDADDGLDVVEKEPPPAIKSQEEVAKKYGSWLDEYAGPWEKRFGAATFDYGRAARPMKRLEAEHTKPVVIEHWKFYCSVEAAEYANPQSFASKFGEYDPDNQTPSPLTPTAT